MEYSMDALCSDLLASFDCFSKIDAIRERSSSVKTLSRMRILRVWFTAFQAYQSFYRSLLNNTHHSNQQPSVA